jgi:quinone-modifying oxidoreductase subunit QmoC
MPEPYRVRPDGEFLREILAHGGQDLKKCFQCATCSVACALAPENRPFPRKEMIWAQWGLKDKLLGDPDVWLCYGCGDCTVRCPRGARPGDVVAAVREHTIEAFAVPSFMGRLAIHPRNLLLMLAIPTLLILGLIHFFGDFTPEPPNGHVEYSYFLPHVPLILFFQACTGLAALGALLGIVRFWKALEGQALPGTRRSLMGSVVLAVKEVLMHSRFRECVDRRARALSHLLVFYGFLGLFIVTGAVVISKYVFHYYPIDWWHPLKWLGNLSTVAMFAGLVMMIRERWQGAGRLERSHPQDWLFLGLLLSVVVTGAVTEAVRFASIPGVAYPLYVVHLVIVFTLLVYLPYSRFAHMIYRTVALVHAFHAGRENPADAIKRRQEDRKQEGTRP